MKMNRVWNLFSGRKTRLGALSGGGVGLLAAGLILANLLSQHFFLRLDWTQGGRYSLSRASKKLVRNLPDPVIFRAYISGGLPQPYESNARYLVDLLGEYRAAAGSKVRVEARDPESSPKTKEDAQRAGVAPIRITQMASDQFQIREGFLGLAIFYQDKQEVMPFIKDADGLEYEITSRLRKMSRTERKVLGLVTGHGETSPGQLREGVGAKLFDAFQVTTVELSTRTSASPDVLFVVNPQRKFSDSELDILDARVSSGTPAAFFLGKKAVNLQNFRALPYSTGLDDFLAHYGVRVGDDFVLDAQCQQVSIQSRQGGYTVSNIINYPLFILSRPDGGHPLTKSLEALAFPFAHSLIPTGAPGMTVTGLAKSSPHSWMAVDLESVDPFSIRGPAPTDPRGPFLLAAVVEGSTVSFRDPSRTARARLAVVGTGAFVEENLPLTPSNGDFLVNLAEWMVQDKDFLSIPTRGPAFRPLRQAPVPVRWIVKVGGHFLPPVGFVLWGLVRWRRRRSRRSLIQKEWEAAARGS